jgi:7-keto-8-aminopelargonate synthetase-like enzyme
MFSFTFLIQCLKCGNSLPFFIENELNPRLLDSTDERITILTDAVPSFQIKAIDLAVIDLIAVNKALVVDESHSLGVLGNNGCGIFLLSNKNIKRKIMVASLGKAIGITGGVIASDQLFINQLLSNSSFISSAGMSQPLRSNGRSGSSL